MNYKKKAEQKDRLSWLSQKGFVIEESFMGKKGALLIRDKRTGQNFFYKDELIDEFQQELISEAQSGRFIFEVPQIVEQGENYFISEYIPGVEFNHYYHNEKDKWKDIFEISSKVADSYQLLLKKKNFAPCFKEGKDWTLAKLQEWGGYLVKSLKIEEKYLNVLKEKTEQAIDANRDLIQRVHGNIIGDHLKAFKGKTYLFDLAAVPRFGGVIYEKIRTVDHFLIKSQASDHSVCDFVEKLILQYREENTIPKDIFKLVVAFRFIGIYGQDHLNLQNPLSEIRQDKALQFIKMKF